MTVWEKNREVLAKHYSGLLEDICTPSPQSPVPSPQIKIENTSAGYPALNVKGVSIHSQRDPVREAKRLVDTVREGEGAVVVLGFGLGYAALAAAELGRPVVIVEKYKELIVKAFELLDFSEFLSRNRIIFVLGGTGEGILGALEIAEEFAAGEPSVIRNRALYGLDEEWYSAVEERIHTWGMKDRVNTATFNRFGKRWVRNLSRNMEAIRDFPGVSWFEGLARNTSHGGTVEPEVRAQRNLGISSHEGTKVRRHEEEKVELREKVPVPCSLFPVFLAAAGPSLDRIKPLLRDIYRRCIVIAVDTNLRFFFGKRDRA